MLILSIDVGMKNLAHCLMRVDEKRVTMLDWDVVDLTLSKKCFKCAKTAIVAGEFGAACKTHRPVFKTTGAKKEDLETLCKKYALKTGSREEMAKQLTLFKKSAPLTSSSVSRGRELCNAYTRFDAHKIDVVLLENQMAAKMAVVQGMLLQYWVQKGVETIEIVSPVQKLKTLPKSAKETYAMRKKASVERTRELLLKYECSDAVFDKHKKKDDLADTFLQAVWYIESRP